MKNIETIRIHKAWREIKSYVKIHRDWIKGSGAENLKTLSDFKSYYKSMVGRGVNRSDLLVVRNLKSHLRFKTSLRAAKAFKQPGITVLQKKVGKYKNGKIKYKKIGTVEKSPVDELSLKEIRNLSTRDLASMRKDEIKSMYHNLLKNGYKSSDAKKEIAAFYFGS